MIPLHNDIVAPYIYLIWHRRTKDEYLPKCASGEIVLAIAMTEPEAGSDLAGMKTSAVSMAIAGCSMVRKHLYQMVSCRSGYSCSQVVKRVASPSVGKPFFS
jgi:hypothetical protein